MFDADHHARRQHLLRKLGSLARLSAPDAEAILDLPMEIKAWPARHVLFQEWRTLSACHLILDGFAGRHKSLHDGSQQILSFHIPGDYLDLQGFHPETMDYGVSTLVPTVVGRVTHATLHDLIRRHPSITQAFWRDTLADAAIFRERMLSLGRRSAREHLAHLLCEMTWRFRTLSPPVSRMPMARDDLADALGLTGVEVSRELEAMRRDGLIEPGASTVEVLDFDALARLSNFHPAYLHQDRAA